MATTPGVYNQHLENVTDDYNTLGANIQTTILDAVNEVLESVHEFPVDALPANAVGVTIQSRALRYLERANIRMQSWGWPENTMTSQEFYIQDDSTIGEVSDLEDLQTSTGHVLYICGAGRDSHRALSVMLQEEGSASAHTYTSKVGDSDAGVDYLGATTGADNPELQLDVVVKRPFSTLGAMLQGLIVKTAAQEMQRRLQGSPEADQMLMQERVLADTLVMRNRRGRGPREINASSPLVEMMQQQMQQQQQQQAQ